MSHFARCRRSACRAACPHAPPHAAHPQPRASRRPPRASSHCSARETSSFHSCCAPPRLASRQLPPHSHVRHLRRTHAHHPGSAAGRGGSFPGVCLGCSLPACEQERLFLPPPVPPLPPLCVQRSDDACAAQASGAPPGSLHQVVRINVAGDSDDEDSWDWAGRRRKGSQASPAYADAFLSAAPHFSESPCGNMFASAWDACRGGSAHAAARHCAHGRIDKHGIYAASPGCAEAGGRCC